MDKDAWMFLIGMLTIISILGILIVSVRGCTENQSKLYVECVKSMHGRSGAEVQQACNRVRE